MSAALYKKVYSELRDEIASGKYSPGEAIPSERKLGQAFGVSQITIRRAVNDLVLDGLIQKRQGIGNIVRKAVPDVQVEMSSFTSDVVDGRLRLVRTLLSDELAPVSSEIADKLGVPIGSMLRQLVRLDTEGGLPFSIDKVFIKPSLANHITPEIAASAAFLHLWQLVSKIQLVTTDYQISVQLPDAQDQELLHISPDFPLLVTGELVHDKEHQPCAWIESRYRSDRCRLTGRAYLVQRETEQGIVGE